MACVRLVVLIAILGVIVVVVYDNIRSDQGSVTALYSVPKAGDAATLSNNAVACPIPEDALKVKDLLRSFTDRQPAATYAVEHGCSVLTKLKSYTIRAYSSRHGAVCLEVPDQKPCYWTTVDGLTTK
jgi:hypothetical protein